MSHITLWLCKERHANSFTRAVMVRICAAFVLATALCAASPPLPQVRASSPSRSTPHLRTTQLVLPLGPLPRRPLLMQLNTRILISELSQTLGRPAKLDDVPDATLDELAHTGYHIIYLLGVWKTGTFGLNKRKLLLQDPCMSGFPEDAVGSSPFAITDYSVAHELGGDEALERLCARIRSRRMRVIVDFVPNHVLFLIIVCQLSHQLTLILHLVHLTFDLMPSRLRLIIHGSTRTRTS